MAPRRCLLVKLILFMNLIIRLLIKLCLSARAIKLLIASMRAPLHVCDYSLMVTVQGYRSQQLARHPLHITCYWHYRQYIHTLSGKQHNVNHELTFTIEMIISIIFKP